MSNISDVKDQLHHLSNEVKELRETVQWKKTRPLIRFNKEFFLQFLIILDLVFKIIVIYKLFAL